MNASSPAKPASAADPVVEKLMDGHYDRQLAAFEARLEEAAAMLRRAHAAMKAENTLRS
ncbi:hypothetical protein [Phenylobacterium sp.]|uniref:hypothetical protein n=1 Tax=Phenylobacterium sp. TaxID=1871053 RepID=UPI00301CB524